MAKLSTRTFGVEFELFFTREGWEKLEDDYSLYLGGDSNDYGFLRRFLNGNGFRGWEVTSDSSIHSEEDEGHVDAEIVTPILQGPSGLKQILKFCNIMKEYATVNQSTGLHVHVGAADFANKDTAAEKLTMALLQYGSVDKVFDSLVMAHRRGNEQEYAQGSGSTEEILRKYKTIILEQSNTLDRIIRTLQNSRYRKINLHALEKHGTIEFRQMHGTLNPELVKNWVIICMAFLDSISETEGVFLQALRELKQNTLVTSKDIQLNEMTIRSAAAEAIYAFKAQIEKLFQGMVKDYIKYTPLSKNINPREASRMMIRSIEPNKFMPEEIISGEKYCVVSYDLSDFGNIFLDGNIPKGISDVFGYIFDIMPVWNDRIKISFSDNSFILKFKKSYATAIGSRKGTLNAKDKPVASNAEVNLAQTAGNQSAVALPQRNINKLQTQTNKFPLSEIKKWLDKQ